MKDFYAILQVQPNCSAEEIREAYKRLAREFHPDGHPRQDDARAAYYAEAMVAVNEAYETLKDPAKRRAYDLQFKLRQFTPPKVEDSGTLDLLGFVTGTLSARVPQNIMNALLPALGHALEDRGINPKAATAEQILQAMGFLKPVKARRKRRA